MIGTCFNDLRSHHVRSHFLVRGWALALTVLLLWPQRGSGYGLGHDMVFTGHQPLNDATLGVSSAPPRAVPLDAFIALLEHFVDGEVLGRLALAAPLLLAGLGAAALLDGTTLAARLAACGFAIWNPYVIERLAIGQWALLWGYATIPWLMRATLRHRRGQLRLHRLVLPLAAASITPTGGVLACLVVFAVETLPGPRLGPGARLGWLRSASLAVALQAPWILAALLGSAATFSDPASVAAFASRSELAGVPLTALTLGGIWDGDLAPPSRGGLLQILTLVVVVASALIGWRLLGRIDADAVAALAGCAAVGFVLAVASSVPGLSELLRWTVSTVPGGGLLRDAQKWLALLAVLEAVLLGATVEVLARRAAAARPGDHAVTTLLLAVGLAVPLALLPDATRVVWPTLTPVNYPAGYATVDRFTLHGGDVAVVPFQPYRQFAWAGNRNSIDPAPRLLRATVVTSDRLQVGARLLAGEDPRASRVAAALTQPKMVSTSLADDGIGWVLIELRTPGDVPSLTGLIRVYADRDVQLYRVPGAIRVAGPRTWRVVAASGALALWVLAVLCAVAMVGAAALRSRRRPVVTGE